MWERATPHSGWFDEIFEKHFSLFQHEPGSLINLDEWAAFFVAKVWCWPRASVICYSSLFTTNLTPFFLKIPTNCIDFDELGVSRSTRHLAGQNQCSWWEFWQFAIWPLCQNSNQVHRDPRGVPASLLRDKAQGRAALEEDEDIINTKYWNFHLIYG